MIILALVSLAVAIACYLVSQLQQHGKLKWQNESKDYFSFWGRNSWVRKYAGKHKGAAIFENIKNPNWYYRLFNIKYKERWFTSTNLTVFLTDGYHLMQFFFFIFISLSVAFALGLTWWWFGIWIGVHVIHAGLYKLLSR